MRLIYYNLPARRRLHTVHATTADKLRRGNLSAGAGCPRYGAHMSATQVWLSLHVKPSLFMKPMMPWWQIWGAATQQNIHHGLTQRKRTLLSQQPSGVPMVFPFFLERRVPLLRRGSPRGAARTDVWGQVESRDAVLTIRAGSFAISPGNGGAYHLPKELKLNYVEVVEQHPPADMEPVHWRLMTAEPVDTIEQVAAVVDAYRSRWQIEEFFKALKTCCQYEKLQLESGDALVKALAM